MVYIVNKLSENIQQALKQNRKKLKLGKHLRQHMKN